MGITQGVKSQLGGLGKGAVKQIVQEPVEIGKVAAKQVVGTESLGGQPASRQGGQTTSQLPPQPSLEEQKKTRILFAHRRELEEEITHQRRERVQKIEQQKMMEKKKEEEKRVQKEKESETIFQKGLSLVIGRLKRRIETRFPKAA